MGSLPETRTQITRRSDLSCRCTVMKIISQPHSTSNKLSPTRANTNMGTRKGREGDSGDGMDFQDAFESVFDENQPDVAPFEVREGIEEIWSGRKICEEAVNGLPANLSMEQRRTEMTTESEENLYHAQTSGVLARIDRLHYEAHFDGYKLLIFEEGGGMNILLHKAFTGGNYRVLSLNLKLGHGSYHTVLERRYGVDQQEENEVIHEHIPMARGEELRFSIEIKYMGSY